MKRRYLLLFFIAVLTILALFSCKAKDKGDTNKTAGDVIYDSNTSVAIVRGASDNENLNEAVLSLYSALEGKVKGAPEIISSSDASRAHEIVLGKSERPVSIEAYKLLERIRLEPEQEEEGWPRP